jgi:hypothetical protein
MSAPAWLVASYWCFRTSLVKILIFCWAWE